MSRKHSPLSNEEEIKHILEDQELREENEELIETNEELVEENEKLETEVKKFKKEFVWLILLMLLVSVVLGSAIGYYYFQNIKTSQNLSETAKKAQTAEEKAMVENKLRLDQEIKLTQATKENQELKDRAAKKAQEEAEKELKAKEEAEKNSKKYVVANKKESTAPGLNTRITPCGDLIGTLRVWGTAGEVLEGSKKPGPCLDGDYEWYRVKWNDGVEGWSIVNYLDFTGEKQFSKTGYITGYVPIGYDYETDKTTYIPKICATNQADNITYCNAEINKDQQNYKLVVPEGDYVMSGTYKYKEYQTKKIVEFPLIYALSQQCGYTQECYKKYPEGYKTPAKIRVDINSISIGINLNVLYPDSPGGQF